MISKPEQPKKRKSISENLKPQKKRQTKAEKLLQLLQEIQQRQLKQEEQYQFLRQKFISLSQPNPPNSLINNQPNNSQQIPHNQILPNQQINQNQSLNQNQISHFNQNNQMPQNNQHNQMNLFNPVVPSTVNNQKSFQNIDPKKIKKGIKKKKKSFHLKI